MRQVWVGLAAVVAALVVACVAEAQHASSAEIHAVGHFYSDYEHFAVHGVAGYHPSCVKDKYGGWNKQGCYDIAGNNADYDVTVYQTYPTWKMVYSDRSSLFGGKASVDLFWQSELQAPYCFTAKYWARNYKAVFRMFDPLTDAVSARDTETFGVHCS